MIIKIDDQWFIEDNGSGYTIYHETGKTDKDGEKLTDIQKYPPTLAGAVKIYARFKNVDNGELVSLKQYVEVLTKTYRDLKNSLEIK